MYLWKVAKDYAAQQKRAANKMKHIIQKQESIINESNDTKRQLQKEWANNEAAHWRGGATVLWTACQWHFSICNTQKYTENVQTLYGEEPTDILSVNFVWECQVVVEISGETITALKLASTESWKQLWTDATSWRTALVIGLLGDGDTIDPVVISSCIL